MTSKLAYLLMALVVSGLTACGGAGNSTSSATSTTTSAASVCPLTTVPVSISLTPSNPTILKGASQQFVATGTFADGKKTALSTGLAWSTTDTAVLNVFESGLVEGIAVGTGTVKVSVCGISASAAINVNGPFAAITAGGSHTIARKSDGSVFTWGLNRHGQLGIGTRDDKAVVTQEKNATLKWSALAGGEFHTMALDSCGSTGCSLYAWGKNENGQLGFGTTSSTATNTDYLERLIPTKVGTAVNWSSVSAGASHTVAVNKKGEIWAWGGNSNGQLGHGTTVGPVGTSVPTLVTPLAVQTAVPINNAKKWKTVAAGYYHSVALMLDGTAYAWGSNDRGQLGLNDTTVASANTPTLVATTDKFSAIATAGDHVLAIRSDGALFAWGANGFGQLGVETLVDSPQPVRIGLDTNWLQIAAGGIHNDANGDIPLNGGHSLAIRTDGTLWAWGANGFGQLGDGSTNDAWVPIQIGTDKDWIAVTAGKLHSFALKANGTLWGWGRNVEGQLGNGESGLTAKLVLRPTMLVH